MIRSYPVIRSANVSGRLPNRLGPPLRIHSVFKINRTESTQRLQRAVRVLFPSNLTRALLLLDQRLAGAFPNLANSLRASSLSPAIREAVILRVAALHGSAYERMQHLDQARMVGWSDSDIAAIETAPESLDNPDLRVILTFADACVAGSYIPDDLFAGIGKVLSDRDVATVILLVGHYMMVARFLGVLQIELDPQPDPWINEH